MANEAFLRGASLGAQIVNEGFDEYWKQKQFQEQLAQRKEVASERRQQQQNINQYRQGELGYKKSELQYKTNRENKIDQWHQEEVDERKRHDEAMEGAKNDFDKKMRPYRDAQKTAHSDLHVLQASVTAKPEEIKAAKAKADKADTDLIKATQMHYPEYQEIMDQNKQDPMTKWGLNTPKPTAGGEDAEPLESD